MQRIIDRILEGEFDYETGSLDFSYPKIELNLHEGEVREGSFFIYGAEDRLTEGTVSSSNPRMKCLTEVFTGAKEEIAYEFHSEGMCEGESVRGEFFIISNQGEYTLPYEITITPQIIETSLGSIKNLFHFANLAKTNWAEAVHLFYSPEFEKIFTGVDRQHYIVYRGLSAIPGNEQNVEEFLLEINKKQQIDYLLNEEEIRIENPKEEERYQLTINRNGWGYTHLEVRVDGDFIDIEKDQISEEDFLGNCYHFPFYINQEYLHSGRNYGYIEFFNSYVSLRMKILVIRHGEQRRILGHRQERKHLTTQIVNYYEAFRTKRVGATVWLQETQTIVDKMLSIEEGSDEAKLYQAQLLITQERYNEAKWLLSQIEQNYSERKNPTLLCYYLYLTTLYTREEAYIDSIAKRVEEIYLRNRSNWRIAWLLLYLSEDYSRSPSKKWLVLEEQFRYNCNSPILYIEAWHLLAMNPSLLMKLERFELQVINYAVKKSLLTAEVANQVAYLSLKQKEFSHIRFSILKACYEVHPSDEILQTICTMLIKANRVGDEYFEWYERSILKEQRITRLYEYYMMSLDMEKNIVIPKIVLMYFAFDSDLDYIRNSYLYAYVYKNQEAFQELFETYREQIERFVITQIGKGHINKWLAYLYKKMITASMITQETANGLANILFTNRIRIKKKGIKQLIVVYEKCNTELRVPVNGENAYIPLFGSDYRLLLEDAEYNRFSQTGIYTAEKLLVPDKVALMIAPLVENNIGFDIWMCEHGKDASQITDANVDRMRRVAESDLFEARYRKTVRMKLLHFYYEQDYIKELTDYLETLKPQMFDSRECAEIIQMMVHLGMNETAFEWVQGGGSYQVEAKIIVRLCSRLLEDEDYAENPVLESLIYTAFKKGKHNEVLLQYLVERYNGSIKEMRNVWKAAVSFGIDTYAICERMLLQMLYTGAFVGERIEIFKDYIAGGAKANLETAFLAQCAYDYFVKEKITDSFIIKDMLRVMERQEQLGLVCKLAFVKYFAENLNELDESTKPFVEEFLREFIKEDIYFPFFKNYMNVFEFMLLFTDKTMVEYRANSGNKAVIHYLIERDSGVEGEYTMEEMKDMYVGVCVKQFILFFGERLQYYITEVVDGKEQLTESNTLSRNDMDSEQKESRYNSINDIAIGKTLQDYDTVDGLLYEYYKQDYMCAQLFSLQ